MLVDAYLEEHVLSTAEPDSLRPELLRLVGFFHGIRIGKYAHAFVL